MASSVDPEAGGNPLTSLFGHIKRQARSLPPVVHYNHTLAMKGRKKVGKDYQETFTPYSKTFGIDMQSLRSGWVHYAKGVGRVLTTAYVLQGEKVPEQPAENASGIALVVVASEKGVAELEIDDEQISAGFQALLREYADCPKSSEGLVPEVRFIGGLSGCKFEIIGWEERDEDLFGAL